MPRPSGRAGPPSTQPSATPAFLGGHRPHSHKPKIGDANGVARSRRLFPPTRKPFCTTQTEVITTIHTRPRRARWSASEPSPQGEPTLPATRHLQVEREWCPATLAAQADSDGYGLRMVRNTYQNFWSLTDPGDRYEGPGGRVRWGDRSRRILMLFDEKDRPSWPASRVRSRSVLGLSGSPTPCTT